MTTFELDNVKARYRPRTALPAPLDDLTLEVRGVLREGKRTWDLTVEVATDLPGGGMRPYAFRLVERDSTRPRLTAELQRGISWPQILREAERHLAGLDDETRVLFDDVLDAFRETPRPGKQKRGDSFYAVWADRYVQVGGKSPVKDLADTYGLVPETVSHFIAEARRRKLLTKPQSGKAGGILTPRGRKALEEAQSGQH